MRRALLTSLLCLLSLSPVLAGLARADHGGDYELARQLHRAGEIVAVDELLADVRRRIDGTLLEIELEIEDGRYLYEIEMLGEDGNVHEFYYDARTGKFLRRDLED